MDKERNRFKTNKLKQNNRWVGFQKSFSDEKQSENNLESSRFKNLNSFNTTNGDNRYEKRKFGKKGKFGKRIYKSMYNKEETLKYFNTHKAATVKETSLFNFIKKDTKKNKKRDKNEIKKNNDVGFSKTEMTEEEKKFITSQYMYEEASDEDINDNNIEEINEKTNDNSNDNSNEIIDF